MSHRAAVRLASLKVHCSVVTCTRSLDGARQARAASGRAVESPPSGSCPRSSGRSFANTAATSVASALNPATTHQPMRQLPCAARITESSSRAATNPPNPPPDRSIDRANARRRTNHRATPVCVATAPPVATPPPTSIPNANIAPTPLETNRAMSSEPVITIRPPRTSVKRMPRRLTHNAANGPGKPDMSR